LPNPPSSYELPTLPSPPGSYDAINFLNPPSPYYDFTTDSSIPLSLYEPFELPSSPKDDNDQNKSTVSRSGSTLSLFSDPTEMKNNDVANLSVMATTNSAYSNDKLPAKKEFASREQHHETADIFARRKTEPTRPPPQEECASREQHHETAEIFARRKTEPTRPPPPSRHQPQQRSFVKSHSADAAPPHRRGGTINRYSSTPHFQNSMYNQKVERILNMKRDLEQKKKEHKRNSSNIKSRTKFPK